MGRVGSDGSGFGDMQFATDYNNGITYVMNVLCGSGRVQKRVTRGQLWVTVDQRSAVFTCIGALGTRSRTGPLARKYLPGFPCS